VLIWLQELLWQISLLRQIALLRQIVLLWQVACASSLLRIGGFARQKRADVLAVPNDRGFDDRPQRPLPGRHPAGNGAQPANAAGRVRKPK
jgi:hypothetical protein